MTGSLGPDGDFVPDPGQWPGPGATPQTCRYRDFCPSCGFAVCYHATNGPRFGRAEAATMGDGSAGVVRVVDDPACLACLASARRPA